MILDKSQRAEFGTIIRGVQDRLTAALEAIDGAAHFERKPWTRTASSTGPAEALGGGGGVMAVLRGAVVEKAGVNFSEVEGPSYPAIEGDHKGKPFYAAGVSTITHMNNPHAPIGHMNIRLLDVGDTFWIGGGADMTPFMKYEEDTAEFHQSLKKACEHWAPDAYERFSKWCDEYFYIPHRQSVRGVGGVFFDYLKGDFAASVRFAAAVAEAYVETYPKILARRKDQPYTPADKDGQLYWRGRYAEFNLVYDRGTKFGLMTGGNIEAIFVSLPPVVKW